MRYRTIAVLIVAAACIGGCTNTAEVPATAPPTTAPANAMTTTTTVPSPTTTVLAPTTTLDRITEVTRIFEDLERRRLAAISSGDVSAFSALFADTPYLDRSLEVFDLAEPGPTPKIAIQLIEILRDDEQCLAVWASAVVDGKQVPPTTTVLEPLRDGWGFSYVTDERGGWLCDGAHPLSG